MAELKNMHAKTGRMIKEDGTILNVANTLEAMAAAQGVSGNQTFYKLAADPLPTENVQEEDMCISIGNEGIENSYIYLQGQWRVM